jgi:lysophospholipase L1-like esterase
VPPTLFDHGYVDGLSQRLHSIRPDIKTINYGCPGETTDSFIGGGCLYTTEGLQLHDSYSDSQLDAAITFLSAHHGQVSPITFNLGANDLNALQGLCKDKVECYENQGPIVLERIRENLDEILGALRAAAPDSEILTFTQYSVGFLIDPRFLQLTEAFNAVVVATAAAHRVRVADVYAAFNGPLQPQPATICDLTLVCPPSNDSHPSDAGYQVIAEELWQAAAYEKLEY